MASSSGSHQLVSVSVGGPGPFMKLHLHSGLHRKGPDPHPPPPRAARAPHYRHLERRGTRRLWKTAPHAAAL